MGEYGRFNHLTLGNSRLISKTMSEYKMLVDELLTYVQRVDNNWVTVEVPHELIFIPDSLRRTGDELSLTYESGLLIASRCPYVLTGECTVCYIYYPY